MEAAARKPTVLIVDDDRGLARLIEKAVRREGLETATASSGTEAIEWVQHHHADLMLLDLQLPDLHGVDVVERLAAVGRPTPFVIITGQGDERVAVEMMKRGALDYLVKDVQFLEFVPTVVRRSLTQLDREKRLTAAEEALKRENAFTNAVLDTAGAIIIVTDAQGRLVRLNRACEKTSGFKADEVMGQFYWEFFLARNEWTLAQKQIRAIRSNPQLQEWEGYLLTKAGERRLISWSVTALLNEKGEVEHIVASGVDITERKRLEAEILEISEREQQRIGQDLHDDLGQQLAGAWCLSVVLEKNLTARAAPEAPDAAAIANQLKRSVALTRSLARGLHPVVSEAGGLMSALHDLSARVVDLFKVDCELRCPHGVPLDDNTTATHVYRIAQEAVTNAVRHGGATRIVIELTSARGRITLSVKDNGSGIPKLDPNRKGMGLRIMRYRADMIGGTLEIANNPGAGATVVCTFAGPVTLKRRSAAAGQT